MLKINLEDWVLVGGGVFGNAYFHKTDDSIMLKLNKNTMSEPAEQEFELSRKVFSLGVSTPRVFELATDGTHYGYTSQRINGKKSYSRLIADNPEQIDAFARRYAEQAKKLHATPCDTQQFESYHAKCASVISKTPFLSEPIRNHVLDVLAQIPQTTTCLHGDFQTSNLITTGMENYWIDLGDFRYGNPMFDFTQLYFYQKYLPTAFLKYVIHLNRKQMKSFYKSLYKYYFGADGETEAVKHLLAQTAYVRVMVMATSKSNKLLATILLPIAQKQLGEKSTSRLRILFRLLLGKAAI